MTPLSPPLSSSPASAQVFAPSPANKEASSTEDMHTKSMLALQELQTNLQTLTGKRIGEKEDQKVFLESLRELIDSGKKTQALEKIDKALVRLDANPEGLKNLKKALQESSAISLV